VLWRVKWAGKGNFISLHLAAEDKKDENAFVLAHFTRQTLFSNNDQNQRAKIIFSK